MRITENGLLIAVMLVSILILSPVEAAYKGEAKKGKQLFQAFECVICHLDGGNNINPERPLKGPSFQKRYPDDKQLAKTIREGFPKKGMPDFGKEKLSDNDLSDIMAYIRSLTPAAKKGK